MGSWPPPQILRSDVGPLALRLSFETATASRCRQFKAYLVHGLTAGGSRIGLQADLRYFSDISWTGVLLFMISVVAGAQPLEVSGPQIRRFHTAGTQSRHRPRPDESQVSADNQQKSPTSEGTT
jgi:hypothetical protein